MDQILFDVVTVDGDSMNPTYLNNEKVIVKKQKVYHKNDVIVFKLGKSLYIKRIVAEFNDIIYLSNNVMYINYDYYNIKNYKFRNNVRCCHRALQKGEYFVLSDNYRPSVDSRIFGVICHNNILGKVIFNVSRR